MTERRLGRGLDSLISRTTEAGRTATEAATNSVLEVPVESVHANPDQPRQIMNEAALEGLARSIQQYGVLQPIVVQRVASGFQLVAGERRLRASRLAGKTTVPAIVIEVAGARSLELALIENIQRENLGALEEAAAYEALLLRASLTHQELADRVGKSRASVTNALRLLELPDGVKRLLHSGALSAGQGRALLAAGSPEAVEALAVAACRGNWSVREVERRAQIAASRRVRRGPGGKITGKTFMADYEEQLRILYGTKVAIVESAGRGDVRLAFFSEKDRDRLIHLLLTAGAAAEELASAESKG